MSLQLPRIMYGRYRDVRPRLAKIARRMRKGEAWMPLVEEQGFLDVATTPGYLVGDGPSPLLGAEQHFQVWLLWMLARKGGMREIRDTEEQIFQTSLTRPWSVLGLVLPGSDAWLREQSRRLPFLQAVCPHWDDFIAVGTRYTQGSQNIKALSDMHSTVRYSLGHQGYTYEQVRGEMSGDKLRGMVERVAEAPVGHP